MGWMTGKKTWRDWLFLSPLIAYAIAHDVSCAAWHKLFPKKVSVNVCGKKCDHGSECLLPPKHQGGHDTQHGCIFYDD